MAGSAGVIGNEPTAAFPQFHARTPSEADNPAASNFRLQKFWTLLVEYWWIPGGLLLLSLLIAWLQVLHLPPTYMSAGSMWETMKLHLPEGSLFNENADDLAGTQNDLLHSALMRDRVFARLQAATNRVSIPLDSLGGPLPVTVRILQSTKSAVFSLEALGPQPAYTQAYLEALMQAYLDYKAEIRRQISGDTLASIADQTKQAEQELRRQQDILTDFERTKNLAIMEEEGAVAGSYLTKLKTQLSDLDAEARLLQAASTNLADAGSFLDQTNRMAIELEALASLPGPGLAGAAAELQDKVKELDLLKMQHAALGVNLREEHPKMQQLDSDIERTQKELDIYCRQSREQLVAAGETVRQKLEGVQVSIKEWETRVGDVNNRIAEAEQLKNHVERARGEYDRLSALMQNFKLSRDLDQESLAILEHASPAGRSYGAMKKTLESTILGGVLLGFGCIALLTLRDKKFRSATEVNEKLGNRVIALVPEWPRSNGRLKLPTNGELSHHYAESYRSLRSALLFHTEEARRPRTILITSALPDEGKSTVAANLANTLALGGARVLLVDADLRRGTLHELLNLQREPGLSHLLSHPDETDRIIQTNSIPNLSFISSGGRVNNPGDQLLGAALDQLLRHWRSRFDYVLIDSCPIFPADEATTLAAKVDGTLLVVRNRFSGSDHLQDALDALHRRRVKVLGVVFNRADASSRSYDRKYAKYYAADAAA